LKVETFVKGNIFSGTVASISGVVVIGKKRNIG
jgi:hypothetical protein